MPISFLAYLVWSKNAELQLARERLELERKKYDDAQRAGRKMA